jgi:serine O-acetyltransferase
VAGETVTGDARVAEQIAGNALRDDCGHVPAIVPPSMVQVDLLHRSVRDLLFPGCFAEVPLEEEALSVHLSERLAELRDLLGVLIRASMLAHISHGSRAGDDLAGIESRVRDVLDRFVAHLPELREMAKEDIRAAYAGDPAAVNLEEIILCYPGIEAVYAYRVAHALHEMGVGILPRMLTERAHTRTGVDIHPGAKIGRAFFIDHATGVVVGETAVIGDRVTMYQGVTIGAKKFERDAHGRMVRGIKRHPTIGSDVTIYAGAVILGGDTVIGDGCVISANVFLMESVPEHHVVRQRQGELQVIPLR